MLKSSGFLHTLSEKLPDDRPITALQIVENIDRCPNGFVPIKKTYDQDQDADLWREGSFLKRKSGRYLCISKSEGIPGFVIQEILVFNEKSIPPTGCSILTKTADTEQKAWRKKQLGYKLINKNLTRTAITDIIVCSRLKKAPEGFQFAGDINGLTVCYKMGNTQSDEYSNERGPSRPTPASTGQPQSRVYPHLDDGGDHDYEILNPPGVVPTRPAPKPPAPLPPQNHQHSTHTLSSNFNGLEGVPFVISPKFLNSTNKEKIPVIKARTMQQLLREYNYDFTVERQT